MAKRKSTTLKRWRQFIDIAVDEVTFLNHYARMRDQFNLIASQSPVANVKSEFWPFITQAFAHEMIFRICRITEGQTRDRKGRIRKHMEVSSLMALLEEFAEHPNYLSREGYLGITSLSVEEYLKKNPSRIQPPDHYDYERLNKEFDELAGKGESHISKVQIKSDIEALIKVTKRLKAYRNKHIAHLSVKKGRFKNPQLVELSRAIMRIDKIMRKYFLALNCASIQLDFGHVDITDIFMTPWISDDSKRKSILQKSEKATSRIH